MRGYLLVGHGNFPEALVGSIKMIAGEKDNLYSCCLEPSDGPETFALKLEALEKDLDAYDEVFIFIDMLGGSPGNTAFSYFHDKPKYTLIAGMNFPMILNAILSEGITAEEAIAAGKDSIVDLRHYYASTIAAEDDDIDD